MVFDRRSVISSIRLGPVTTLLGHSVTECGEETGVDDCRGTVSGESPWVVLGRVICNQVSSLVDPISQSGTFGKVAHTGSKPPFRPPGYITTPPKWSSWQISGWLRHPQVLQLGALSTKALSILIDSHKHVVPTLLCADKYSKFLCHLLRRGKKELVGVEPYPCQAEPFLFLHLLWWCQQKIGHTLWLLLGVPPPTCLRYGRELFSSYPGDVELN